MTADRPAVLALRDVSFRYAAGAPWAVDRCTLDVPAGLVVGIAGANGSGKSTLARLMQGLLRPAIGTVTVDGLDTARTPVRRLAAHAGYVAQNPNHQLFASTVAAELAFGPRNLGLPAAEVEDRVADAARRLGLEDVLDRHPYHLGRARRKLVTIASVLAMRTPVLVLDEPTTAQDHRTSDVVGRLIRELRDAGTAVVCISHDVRLLADVADRLVVLDAGRAIADDAPRAVFADGAVMRQARLRPPQVTRLALRLDGPARPWAALSDRRGRRGGARGHGSHRRGSRRGPRPMTSSLPAPGALGFVPGDSWLHRLSPIPKLAWLAAIVAFAFASFDPVALGLIVVVGLVIAISAGIARSLARAVAVLAPLAAAILVLQSIAPTACATGCTPIAAAGPFAVYAEGVARGLVFVLRILAMEVAAIVVLQTTHPSDLFAALARLRVPYVLNLMIALTLQLVPVLQREVGIVLAAQRSRGMRGSGFAAVIPAFVPVFAGTVERVQQLAISLESRGFGATGPRTSYRRVGFTAADAALAVAGIVLGVAGVWASLAGVRVVAIGPLPATLALAVFLVALAVFVASLVRAFVAIGRA